MKFLANEPGSSFTEPETVANVLNSSSVELKLVSTAPKSVSSEPVLSISQLHNYSF